MSEPILDFKPLFFILDRCQNTVLAAKKQDKHEVIGVYIKYLENGEWKIWPANFNNQLPCEFPDRFEFVNDEQEAWLFAVVMCTAQPLPDDWCLEKYPRAEDFPSY